MTAKTTKKPVREENKVRAGTRDNKSEASETVFPDKISEHPRHENFVKFHPPKVNNVPIPSQGKNKRVTKKQLEDLKITLNIKKFFSDHSAITGKINTPDLHFEQQSNTIPNSATHVDEPENVLGVIKRT